MGGLGGNAWQPDVQTSPATLKGLVFSFQDSGSCLLGPEGCFEGGTHRASWIHGPRVAASGWRPRLAASVGRWGG